MVYNYFYMYIVMKAGPGFVLERACLVNSIIASSMGRAGLRYLARPLVFIFEACYLMNENEN